MELSLLSYPIHSPQQARWTSKRWIQMPSKKVTWWLTFREMIPRKILNRCSLLLFMPINIKSNLLNILSSNSIISLITTLPPITCHFVSTIERSIFWFVPHLLIHRWDDKWSQAYEIPIKWCQKTIRQAHGSCGSTMLTKTCSHVHGIHVCSTMVKESSS